MEKESRIKKHLITHKVKYYVGVGVSAGIVIGAGAVWLLTSKNSKLLGAVRQQASITGDDNTLIQQIILDMRGHPGNIIEDLATGTMYPSQNVASKALGVSKAHLSEHLNGKRVLDGIDIVNHGLNLAGNVAA